ncbi:MAG: serine protein kinase RIO [Candidatus Micrarchaeota archaeon]|nr:serine protein kinase RIO [Candidatus Micrarchaeota archaeon]
MARKLSTRKRPRREDKQLKEKKKIESKVFDRYTMLILGGFLNKKIIRSVDYPIASGKEAVVFRATAGEKFEGEEEHIAIKIYKIETSSFARMQTYIRGDPRFLGVGGVKRGIIFAWCRKEFRNLQICKDAEVPAPTPYFFKDNVLLMQFLGEEGIPDSLLVDVGSDNPEKDCNTLIGYVRKLYNRGFVHADISEFNILMHGDVPYLIDMGQGVLLDHPKAEEFMRRDVENILRYFRKYGIEKNGEEVIKWVKGSG